jgi:hypothetical protein
VNRTLGKSFLLPRVIRRDLFLEVSSKHELGTKTRTEWEGNSDVSERHLGTTKRFFRLARRNGALWSYLLCRLLLVITCAVLVGGSALAGTVHDSTAPIFSSSLNPVTVSPAQVAISTPQNPHLLDGALYASIASYRTLDYFSTRRALARGAHEMILPQWVVNSSGTFIAFEGLSAGGEIGSSIWLIRHGHRRLARTMNMISVGAGVGAVADNYSKPWIGR